MFDFLKQKTTMSNIQENKTAIFWHRRDLRTSDNHGLFLALSESTTVVPIFIFDTTILSKLPKEDARVTFLHETIVELANKFSSFGNQLEVYFGDPVELIPQILTQFQASNLYFNKDYEPNAIDRDQKVTALCNAYSIGVFATKDHVIFEEKEIVKDDGLPYTVFTPYMNKWKKAMSASLFQEYDSESIISARKFDKKEVISLAELGFERSEMIHFPEKKIPLSIIKEYHNTRDLPYLNGTSRLGIHLRFGTLSIRKLAKVAWERNEKYFNELIWRDFYAMIIFHFPETVNKAFKKNYEFIPWINNEADFQKWCNGVTGYPIVDAGIRELNATGFMHNRVRMIVASFLCKHLLIDWKWGERYFAEKLLDFDLASNVGGWQWAASSGCDAVPYFRIFNPTAQHEKFDPQSEYVKKWVPEYGTMDYISPMVEHSFARNRAIETFKNTLNQTK